MSDVQPIGSSPAVSEARRLVADAKRIVVLTGAGISTDSGIPDFRGPNGVWTKNPEAEKSATLSNYLSSTEVRKQRWQALLDSPYRGKDPNAGHLALAQLGRSGKLDLLITQNVDGLHLDAGSDPDRLVEIHGTTSRVRCMECPDEAPMEKALARVAAGEADPSCKSCGGILKSATISFGQQLIQTDLERSDSAARNCDLLMAVGTSLAVYPIAQVVPIAHQNDAKIVIVNAEPTEMDQLADVVVHGGISDVLPTIVGDH